AENDGDQEQRAGGNGAGDERRVDLGHLGSEAGHFGVVQALAGVAGQENARVAKDVADEVVHLGLPERTLLFLSGLLRALELGGTADHLDEEVADVNGAVFATEHAVGDTLATDLLAA